MSSIDWNNEFTEAAIQDFYEWLDANSDVVDEDDIEKEYCEDLDEAYTVQVGSIEFLASEVLKEMDQTAYDCGLSDFTDEYNDVSYNGKTRYCKDYTLDELAEIYSEDLGYCEKCKKYYLDGDMTVDIDGNDICLECNE